jgi:transcriptional regulator with XRE-family HTH domain
MKKIKELRLAKGMSQEELAAATGISLRTIQRIEQEHVVPRAYSLKKIALALDINFDELYQQANNTVINTQAMWGQFMNEGFFRIFYSVWATLVFLLLLLNISSQVLGDRFLNTELFFKNDLQVLRSLIMLGCFITIVQIYLLHVRKFVLRPFMYWVLLALFSATSMYLAYSNSFVSSAYFYLNNFQVCLSFFCWLMLLFFGVTYKYFKQVDGFETASHQNIP